MPLLLSMFDQLMKVLSHTSVQNIEKVIPRRDSALGHLVRKMHHEVGIFLEMRPEVAHRELIVVRDIHSLDGFPWKQLLLSTNNLAEEVFVAHQLGRSVQLTLYFGWL